MNKKLLAVVCLIFITLAAWSVPAQRTARRAQWEYRVVALKDDATIERTLNQFGVEGWELIEFEAKSQPDEYGRMSLYYFKRPR